MVVVKEKTTVTQRIHGHCPTHSRTEISVRDVKVVIDEPKEREGAGERGQGHVRERRRGLRRLPFHRGLHQALLG